MRSEGEEQRKKTSRGKALDGGRRGRGEILRGYKSSTRGEEERKQREEMDS